MSRALRPLLLLGAAAVLLLGCGDEDQGTATEGPRPFAFQSGRMNLEGEPSPEDTGPLMAQELGYFRQLKVGVAINSPVHPARPIKYLDEDLVDVAVAHEPELVLSRAKGIPVVAVGALVPEPTMAMIWLRDSGIKSVADLKGKTVAIPGVPFQKDFLEAVLRDAGLSLADVKLERVGYYLESELIQGRADAIFGGSGNVEGATLEARGLDPVVTPVTELGVPAYDELILVARRASFREEPRFFRRILRASIRGNAAAVEHPRAAVKAIGAQAAYKPEVADRYGRDEVRAATIGVEATLPLLSRTGRIDRGRLEGLIEWMHEQGMIERELPVSALLPPS